MERAAAWAMGVTGAGLGAPPAVLYRFGVPGMKRVACAAAALAVRGFYLGQRGRER